MQFDAFAYPAFEQVVSHVAKMGNRTKGALRLPLVIRIPYGGGIGGVEHHCDSSEAYYVHTPGLTVIAPSTPQDAYSLLRAAIRHPGPRRLPRAQEAVLVEGTGRHERRRRRSARRRSCAPAPT